MANAAAAAGARAALARCLREDASEYPVAVVRHASCTCGKDAFRVQAIDDGVLRHCLACGAAHFVCDSAEYWDDGGPPDDCQCPCTNETFRLAAGFARYRGSKDVRWIYVALRCLACGKAGIYADWKIDYAPSAQLLDQA